MRIEISPAALPWVALLVGFVLLVVGTWRLMEGSDTRGWESTRGTVEISEVDRRMVSSSGTRRTKHYAVVRYRYQVEGQSYHNDRVSVGGGERRTSAVFFSSGGGTGTLTEARSIVDRYPQGASVTVFYDPADPTRSVLEQGTGGYAWLWLLVGVVACLYGGAHWVLMPGAAGGDGED